ncbi:YihY/virulence factor BrkB family protein [Cryptosporangium phraense]|uniref:YihY/virulence factor BrkB family protein n=1 Tax=Cryptosporangium phraense TaxID=2593070 RepID=A0A545AUD3_9ACTN|nr:YihY/virulence factor BrkB family protein [Cryptosporangium phraense]TQS44947.1 YihY/virulence factor BrkB family protein [Cryptosporangium phraense]
MADRFVAFPGVPSWVVGPVRRARDRWRWFDTVIVAAVRFDDVHGGRLAAGMTYYAFLAAFPLGLLSFSILGFLLSDDAALTMQVEQFLLQNIPGLPVSAIADARNTAGIIGIFGFLFAGQRWVDCIRSSVRAVWRRNEFPSNWFVRTFSDLVALIGLGAALLLSVGVTVMISSGAEWALGAAGQDGPIGTTTLSVLAFLAGMIVNVVAFVGFLAGLPRLRMSFRRVIGPALLGAVGLELLKTVGRVYINMTESNPAYTVVAGTVGLLVFLNLFDQLLLYCAALTAVAKRGGAVVDRTASSDEADCVEVVAVIETPPADAGRSADGDHADDGDGPGQPTVRYIAAEDGRPIAGGGRTDLDRAPVVTSAEAHPAPPDTAAARDDVVARPGPAPAEP